jgi:hypothetical protein
MRRTVRGAGPTGTLTEREEPVELTVEVIDRLAMIDQGGLRVTIGAASLAEPAVDVADPPAGQGRRAASGSLP